MTTAQVIVALLATIGIAAAIAALALSPPRRTPASLLLVGVVALPFALVLAAPFGSDDEPPPAAAPTAAAGVSCRIVSAGKGTKASEPRYEVTPAGCRPAKGGAIKFTVEANAIRSSSGEVLRLDPGWVSGNVDDSTAKGGAPHVTGWAASSKARSPADSVLVFLNDVFIAAIKPTMDRPDVADSLKAPVALSGFRFELALALDELPKGLEAGAKLRLFGVQGKRASVIDLPCDRKPKPFGC